MDPQYVIAWSVAGLLLCSVLALIVAMGLAARLSKLASIIETQTLPELRTLRDCMLRVESVAASTEKLMESSVAPVIANVQETTKAIGQSAGSMRSMVLRMENAVAKPIALIAAAGNALDTPGGKAGLLALTLGLARYSQKRRESKTEYASEPISAGRKNGATANH